MVWARHRHAPWYLGGMSFVESSFFPVPPDVMLAPMCLAQPHRAWRLALLTTLASVAGGFLGYSIGYFAIDTLLPWLQESRYWPAYQKAVDWFGDWGFWAVFIAGFSPIPYKVFTIAAGALSMALLPFTLASLSGSPRLGHPCGAGRRPAGLSLIEPQRQIEGFDFTRRRQRHEWIGLPDETETQETTK
jgi:membrane protein YqaA with SNARE-associated domain